MGDITIGEYLLTRLHQLGARDIFGVPGDFALTFNKVVADSKILRWVGTCNELNAAYAADGYARIKGVGAVSVTYGVGELSALNGIAGAYTERVPVVIITGSPPSTSYSTQPLLHHTLGDYDIPRKIFKTVCCAAITILDSEKGPEMIDQLRLMSECALRQSLTIEYCRALTTCIREQRPVYISLPADLVNAKCPAPLPNWKPKVQPFVDAAALSEGTLCDNQRS
jgi:indolepyruvate decarboxylase